MILKDKTITLDLRGYTNEVGTPEAEQELSEKRAIKIADFLKARGIDASRITIKGFGGKELKVNKIDEQNRRVEIIINKIEKIENAGASKVTVESVKPIETRSINLLVLNNNNDLIPANVEIKKRKRDDVVYSVKAEVRGNSKIEIPTGQDIELLVSANDYMPKKVILEENKSSYKVILEKIEKNKTFIVDNIYFTVNQAVLEKKSYDILNQLFLMLKENPDINIEIYGHTDNTGSSSSNLILSQGRADAVLNYLVKKGVARIRIAAIGYGSSKPVSDNYSEEGRRKNRRTEFYIK